MKPSWWESVENHAYQTPARSDEASRLLRVLFEYTVELRERCENLEKASKEDE